MSQAQQQEARELRQLIQDALPNETAPYGELPALREVSLPKSHMRALHPNAMLVVGGRGTGKSFWWNVLQSSEHRELIQELQPDTKLDRSTLCIPGFGVSASPRHYPSREELIALPEEHGCSFQDIWKTIVVFGIFSEVAKLVSDEDNVPELSRWRDGAVSSMVDWDERISWVKDNPGLVARLLEESDRELHRQGRFLLVLFDGLDRYASRWNDFFRITRALLQTVLDLRTTKRLRAKVFLRTDQYDPRRLAGFPDASKLFTSRVQLAWRSTEIYSLLFHLLANHPVQGQLFRSIAEEVTVVVRKRGRKRVEEQPAPWREHRGVWSVPALLQHNKDQQRALFHEFTGQFMGKGPRRGVPYRWVINHLWDAHEEISPRSFLLALRTAAEKTGDAHDRAMTPQALKTGITAASALRVTEIQEDHDWLHSVMPALKGLAVPCEFAEIEARWDQDGVIKRLEEAGQRGSHRLSPAHLSDGAAGIVKDLEQLGILYRTRDGRENMPDIYRIHFGLKRKGGIRPPRSLG